MLRVKSCKPFRLCSFLCAFCMHFMEIRYRLTLLVVTGLSLKG